MAVNIHLDNDGFDCPSEEEIIAWLTPLLIPYQKNASLSISVIGLEEMRALNHQYRQKDKPTNVLSFPCLIPGDIPEGFLGDLVFCAPVIEEEAKTQSKTSTAHWAHLLIHGTLHLLGYDHETESEALEMEKIEIQTLNQLGFPDPYGEKDD